MKQNLPLKLKVARCCLEVFPVASLFTTKPSASRNGAESLGLHFRAEELEKPLLFPAEPFLRLRGTQLLRSLDLTIAWIHIAPAVAFRRKKKKIVDGGSSTKTGYFRARFVLAERNGIANWFTRGSLSVRKKRIERKGTWTSVGKGRNEDEIFPGWTRCRRSRNDNWELKTRGCCSPGRAIIGFFLLFFFTVFTSPEIVL